MKIFHIDAIHADEKMNIINFNGNYIFWKT